MTTAPQITVWPAMAVQIDQQRTRTWLATAARDPGDGPTTVKLWPPLPVADDTAATIAARAKEFRSKRTGINPRSPSATLLDPLEAAGVRLLRADAVGMATAHGLFRDALTAGRLLIVGRSELTEAARLAEERRLAGASAVDGYQGVEPLIACELAVWVVSQGPPRNAGRGRVIALD